jgi:hypothetical protein
VIYRTFGGTISRLLRLVLRKQSSWKNAMRSIQLNVQPMKGNLFLSAVGICWLADFSAELTERK